MIMAFINLGYGKCLYLVIGEVETFEVRVSTPKLAKSRQMNSEHTLSLTSGNRLVDFIAQIHTLA